jgi:hypothetical protein
MPGAAAPVKNKEAVGRPSADGVGKDWLSSLLRTQDRPFHRATMGALKPVSASAQMSFLAIVRAVSNTNPFVARCVQV